MSHQKSINKRLAASKLAGAEGATPETNSNKKSYGSKNKKSK
ncbi:hypothetical protein [Cellulosilyticum ruminicola]|nr:hypothetical protein [Cellulosilyticum ruminicola]